VWDLCHSISNPQGDLQKRGGAGGFGLGDFFGGALGDDLAAGFTGFGADVEDPVGLGGDGHVVRDDDDGVPFIDEAVEADGGFFDEVEVALAEGGVVEGGLGAAAFGEFGDEFDALGLAAGKGGAGLAELEVAEAGVCHELEGVGNAGLGLEEGFDEFFTAGFAEGEIGFISTVLPSAN
jgi:hypothetical protein